MVGGCAHEDRAGDPAVQLEQRADLEALAVALGVVHRQAVIVAKTFRRVEPADDAGDLGSGEETEDGDVLAAAADDLALPAVHGRALNCPELALLQHAGGVLDVVARALEVAAGEDDAVGLAGLDHLVGVGERPAERLLALDRRHGRVLCRARGCHFATTR